MSPPPAGTPRASSLLLGLDGLSTGVVATVWAHSVRKLGLAALRALRIGRRLDPPVGPAHPHLAPRLASFRYGHAGSFLPAVMSGGMRPALCGPRELVLERLERSPARGDLVGG